MLTLRETTASLRYYDEIMKWHFVANNKLKSHQKLSDCSDYISRDRLLKKLRQRYNFTQDDGYYIKNVSLKHAKCDVNVVCYDES